MLLASDLSQALDPVLFAKEALSFTPDPWQEKALRWSGKRLLLNCSRQSGKSTTAAILALHRAIFYPSSLVLLVSPSLRQSSELFRKVRDFLRVLPAEQQPDLIEDNKLSFTMKNKSRIISLPGSEGTIRGFSGANLIIEDEAARVPDDLSFSIPAAKGCTATYTVTALGIFSEHQEPVRIAEGPWTDWVDGKSPVYGGAVVGLADTTEGHKGFFLFEGPKATKFDEVECNWAMVVGFSDQYLAIFAGHSQGEYMSWPESGDLLIYQMLDGAD